MDFAILSRSTTHASSKSIKCPLLQGAQTFYWSSRKKWSVINILLKDPGAVLELIAVMELGVIWGSIDPHFVDDFEPAMTESWLIFLSVE